MKNNKTLPRESGIYKITNLINGHAYIGQSKNIYIRQNQHHRYEYKNESRQNFKLYQAFKKYGLDNFEIEVIELCPVEQLNEREIYWISYQDTFKHGYNMTEGGQNVSPNLFSNETKEKRRKTQEKNKSLQGENHPRAKLTNEEVIHIRQRYKDGETVGQIQEDYKELYPNKESLQQIISGVHYKTVGNIPTQKDKILSRGKLTEQQVKEIRKKQASGKSSTQLSKEYNLSVSSILDIVHYRTYKVILDDEPIEQRRRASYRMTPEQVKEIRQKAAEGISVWVLCQEYHFGPSAIEKCIKRQTYKNIE